MGRQQVHMVFTAVDHLVPDLNSSAAQLGSLIPVEGNTDPGGQASGQRTKLTNGWGEGDGFGNCTAHSREPLHIGMAAELQAEFYAWLNRRNGRSRSILESHFYIEHLVPTTREGTKGEESQLLPTTTEESHWSGRKHE